MIERETRMKEEEEERERERERERKIGFGGISDGGGDVWRVCTSDRLRHAFFFLSLLFGWLITG